MARSDWERETDLGVDRGADQPRLRGHSDLEYPRSVLKIDNYYEMFTFSHSRVGIETHCLSSVGPQVTTCLASHSSVTEVTHTWSSSSLLTLSTLVTGTSIHTV